MKNEEQHITENLKRWDCWSQTYDDQNELQDRLRRDQKTMIDIADIHENCNFIDVGCGTGFAVGLAARKANFQGQFYGIDLSDKMIEKAKANFAGNKNIHFLTSNAESIPLPDKFFDVITCSNSFHHYLHPDIALAQMVRLLKDKGKIYISDLTADAIIVKLFDALLKKLEKAHVKLYSTNEFRSMFERAGLQHFVIKQSGNYIHIGCKK